MHAELGAVARGRGLAPRATSRQANLQRRRHRSRAQRAGRRDRSPQERPNARAARATRQGIVESSVLGRLPRHPKRPTPMLATPIPIDAPQLPNRPIVGEGSQRPRHRARAAGHSATTTCRANAGHRPARRNIWPTPTRIDKRGSTSRNIPASSTLARGAATLRGKTVDGTGNPCLRTIRRDLNRLSSPAVKQKLPSPCPLPKTSELAPPSDRPARIVGEPTPGAATWRLHVDISRSCRVAATRNSRACVATGGPPATPARSSSPHPGRMRPIQTDQLHLVRRATPRFAPMRWHASLTRCATSNCLPDRCQRWPPPTNRSAAYANVPDEITPDCR